VRFPTLEAGRFGHADHRWCVANLSNQHYWNAIE
jgi:hypothetical protein